MLSVSTFAGELFERPKNTLDHMFSYRLAQDRVWTLGPAGSGTVTLGLGLVIDDLHAPTTPGHPIPVTIATRHTSFPGYTYTGPDRMIHDGFGRGGQRATNTQ